LHFTRIAGTVTIHTDYYGRTKIFEAYRTFKFQQKLICYGGHYTRITICTPQQFRLEIQLCVINGRFSSDSLFRKEVSQSTQLGRHPQTQRLLVPPLHIGRAPVTTDLDRLTNNPWQQLEANKIIWI
jgi:hypothetical protein